MKKIKSIKTRKTSAGRRIIASLRQAVDWAEGENVPVRVTVVKAPSVDVRATPGRSKIEMARPSGRAMLPN